MRNLKKILALALVFAMTFAFTASAASFTDQAEIGANYVDDVNMLVELGVIAGYPDGSFGPQKNITRAEFSKMAYTLKYGSDTDGNLFAAQTSQFTDVEGNSQVAWAKGYINYCANQNIVSGVGNNKFNPLGNITVAEATKMILVIMGCNPEKEGFVGSNWMANVTAKAIDLGVFDGWAGDPTTLATRELVAKLMRNAIFSPVYEYSAITGQGSQMDALGTDYNMTLGEKTMGLKSVTGIVVANERYYLDTDEEGNDITDPASEFYPNETISETGLDSEESLIYYEGKDKEGNIGYHVLRIDRALSDDMLGNKVNVFFKADVGSSSEYNYKNVEVIGNVLVNNDTVAYTVPAIATDIMPDGESSSSSEILPYITFTVDGVEKQIKADKKLLDYKVAKNVDAQENEDVAEAFAAYSYTSDASLTDDEATLTYNDAKFIDEMGTPSLSKYRFVSVDGGKTYAYMFKMVSDGEYTATFGSVTSYSESKGTITLTSLPTQDLEDCVINGEIAVDDAVVYYRENGKIVIEKVDTISGSVADYTDDGGVVIDGNTYYAWVDCDLDTASTLFDYYTEYPSASDSATYYVYGNLIMEIDADETVSAAENYAVILRSYYDENMDTAYVKLAFSNNSEGTYAVGNTYLKNSKEPNSSENEGNRSQDFAKNSYFGYVVKYEIDDNGTVDLSSQDLNDLGENVQRGNNLDAAVYDAKVTFDGSNYYRYNDSSILFALYGKPGYILDTESDKYGEVDATTEGYQPVKARAYKIADVGEAVADELDTLYVGQNGEFSEASNLAVSNVVFNTSKGNSKYVVAMSMTVGETNNVKGVSETEALAYVVSATQRYNSATDDYYAVFTIIDENGLRTISTIDDVENLESQTALNGKTIGSLSKAGGMYEAGGFIRYTVNAEGLINCVDNTDIAKGDINFIKDERNGYEDGQVYLVNVVSERNDILTFYPTDKGYDPQGTTGIDSLQYHEDDGCVVICINDDEYLEGSSKVATISSRQTDYTTKGNGNAIIEIREGQIVRVFSFAEGIQVGSAE